MDLLLHRTGWSAQVPFRKAAERDEDRRVEGRAVARHKRTAADLGAWFCFEDEAGQGLRSPVAFPIRNGSSVRVLFGHWHTLVVEQETFASMTVDEVIARFHLAADPLYGRAGSQAIVGRINELDRSPSVCGLPRALQAG